MTLRVVSTGRFALGTEVFDVDGGDRETFVLSDLHVPHGGGPVVGWLGDVLRRAAAARARVLVLGDLFDSYVTPRQLRTGVHRDTAVLFADAARGGADIALLHGNRDFLLGREWTEATGCAVVGGGMRTELAGQRALLLHGDELCVRDEPYQRAKRWLRRPWVKALARSLPMSLADRVARRAREKSRMVIQGGDQSRFLPPGEAIVAALAVDVDLLVFGHIHRLAMGSVAGGSYRVLPAFDERGVHLHARGGLRFEGPGGAEWGGAVAALPGIGGG